MNKTNVSGVTLGCSRHACACGKVKRMTRLSFVSLIALSATIGPPQSNAQTKTPFSGRWDFVVTAKDANYPDWLEIASKDGEWTARMQPRTGSVHPVKIVKLDGDHLALLISAANTKRPDTTWELTSASGKISGVEKHGEEKFATLVGVPAPMLKRDPPKAWTNPEPL